MTDTVSRSTLTVSSAIEAEALPGLGLGAALLHPGGRPAQAAPFSMEKTAP